MMNILNYKILEIPVKVYAKRIAFAGAAGLTCRKCIEEYKKEERGLFATHLQYGAAGGIIGGVRGICLGLWVGGSQAIPYFFGQTMSASLFTFGFFSIRSTLRGMGLNYPFTESPISEHVISSLAGGVAATGVVTLNGLNARSMMTAFSVGLVLGIAGHILLEKGNQLRLEIILRKQYPELLKELSAAENYMDTQQVENPEYDGPKRAMPWSEFARAQLPDPKRFKEKMFEKDYDNLTK